MELISERIVAIEMAERNKNMANSTIEGWNKNKRKQFKICANLYGFAIDKIDIEDVAIKIIINKNILNLVDKCVK